MKIQTPLQDIFEEQKVQGTKPGNFSVKGNL